ncbi:MAG: hypothetical protein NFCOHLIN_01663 [Gammaproteobacteria bacterium]|nr:hypothetical protein [Gammaproteobacteria bacterium]
MTTSDSASISVEILEGREGQLPDIRDAWERCLADAPGHQKLFGYEWYSAWVRHLGSSGPWTGDSRVLVAHDRQGEVRGILPLAKRRTFHVPFWCLSGYFQPVRGFVCHDAVREQVCAALARALLKRQGWFELYRFGPTDTAYAERAKLLEELSDGCRRLVRFVNKPTIVAHDIPASTQQYEEMVRTHSSMKRIRSYERRMQREGKSEIRHYCNPQGEELRAMLEACGTIERKSWLAASKSGQPRYMSQESLQFWEQVCARQLGPKGQLDVWLVFFNGQPIAFRFTLTSATTRYLIANQYDEEFAQYRAGWILYLRDLENCAERGIRAIDMGSGDAHYKSRWGGVESAEGVDFLIFPPGPAGVVAARLMSIDPLYRRARQMLAS